MAWTEKACNHWSWPSLVSHSPFSGSHHFCLKSLPESTTSHTLSLSSIKSTSNHTPPPVLDDNVAVSRPTSLATDSREECSAHVECRGSTTPSLPTSEISMSSFTSISR